MNVPAPPGKETGAVHAPIPKLTRLAEEDNSGRAFASLGAPCHPHGAAPRQSPTFCASEVRPLRPSSAVAAAARNALTPASERF
jgi:hypothetical protein